MAVMGRVRLDSVVRECDTVLDIAAIEDYPGAHNGLQVENRGCVSHIAAVVDATLSTVRLAGSRGANLLLAHHGIFWSSRHPWTGYRYELFRTMVEADMALYSAHLPLDVHEELGNNAGLARALGFEGGKPFFLQRGHDLGLRFDDRSIPRRSLAASLERVLGAPPTVLRGGPSNCTSIGIVTGGAGSELAVAAAEGVDTFITGEGPHWSHALAEELGINVLLGGHYATETFGVKALAAHLEKTFGLTWEFIDYPTGL